ncbi:MAG TPA: hypothetical protein VLF95_04530 [Vicinamibacteria bacterium]|nr:hypothetical protein [Vicinamibacteria bacterium]
MRLAHVVPLALVALAACKPADLKIDVVLEMQKDKCVVRFAEPRFKDAKVAVAYTAHAVIWQVRSNACGEKAKTKTNGKALGLKYLKLRGARESAKWLDRCQPLNLVPARFKTPPTFRCDIPSVEAGGWEGTEEFQIYEYEIDGDSVEPLDPDIGIKRNG